jgi:hypothetical protein
MAALSKSRNTVRQGQAPLRLTVALKANAKVFKGGIVCVDASGYGVAASTATGLIVMGVAQKDVDNTGGSNGAVSVDVEAGALYKFANDGGDAIVAASVGSDCFLTDDQTLAKTDATSTKSRAGKVARLDSDGVWALLGLGN